MSLEKKFLTIVLVAGLAGAPLAADNQEIAPEEENTQESPVLYTFLENDVAQLAKDTVPSVDQIDPDLTEDNSDYCVESLMDTRPDTFCRSNIVVLDTVDDPDSTHVKLFNPALAKIITLSLAKTKTDKDRGKWDNIKVLRRTERIYSANLKLDNKYDGYRTSILGTMFETFLGLKEHYKGTLFLDEYKHYPLWNVLLKDREELSDFLKYLTDNLEKRGKRSFDKKPVLLLTLKDDPYLENLTIEDAAKLKMHFEVVDYRDTKTTAFFTETQLTMDDLIMRFEAGSPIYLGESMKKELFRKFESYCKNFEMDKLLPWAITGVAGICVVEIIKTYFNKHLKEHYQGKVISMMPKPKI